MTLHQWKKLANPTLNLAEERPGVHVKGQGQEMRDTELREHTDASDLDPDDHEYEESIHMRVYRTSESASETTSHTGTEDDDVDDDGPIQMRVNRSGEKERPSSAGAEKAGGVKSTPAVTPPQNLGLMSLVSGHGFQRGFKERGADSGGILTHLLNRPSTSSPGTSSVGQVLADVLQKASNAASEKEPTRAESLRNLAKYFSEKERGTSPTPATVKSPTPIPVVQMPQTSSPGGGVLLSKILASSGLSASLTVPAPITTTAKTSGLPTTTNSTSTSPSILTRGSLVRNSSGSNLLSMAQGSTAEDSSSKRHSLDSSQMLKSVTGSLDSAPGLDFSQLKFPTLRRRASSGDLQEMASSSSSLDDGSGLGARLYRSSSIGNIKDLSNENLSGPSKDVSDGGFFGRLRRSPSIGSLTNLVQRSSISAALPNSLEGSKQRSTSLESFPVFRPGESPPSPSKFDHDGTNFFGRSLSSNNAPSSSADTLSGASGGRGFMVGTRLSGLAGVRGFWSQGGSRSLESPAPPVPQQEPQPKSEERLDRINKAFAFEDFGGLGLMSFFGRKSRDAKSGSQ